MIFLSHNYKDKDVVEPIAMKLMEVYGYDKIFYDSWSIKPGENIIGKMNEGLHQCKWFFYFISENSLNSNMVNLEWQSALYKSAMENVNFIPIKIDDSYPPQILISTLYIDMYTNGLENTIRDVFDIIEEKDSKRYLKTFKNLYYTKEIISDNEYNITICVKKLLEPNAKFLLSYLNETSDLKIKFLSDNMYSNSTGTMQNYNVFSFSLSRTLTKNFPIRLKILCNKNINELNIWHQTSETEIKLLEKI